MTSPVSRQLLEAALPRAGIGALAGAPLGAMAGNAGMFGEDGDALGGALRGAAIGGGLASVPSLIQGAAAHMAEGDIARKMDAMRRMPGGRGAAKTKRAPIAAAEAPTASEVAAASPAVNIPAAAPEAVAEAAAAAPKPKRQRKPRAPASEPAVPPPVPASAAVKKPRGKKKPTVEIPEPEPMLSPFEDTKIAAFTAGSHAALSELGFEKAAFGAAIGAIGRAVAPQLARAGRSFLGGVTGKASLGRSLSAGVGRLSQAGKAGWNALGQAAPNVQKGLQTAGNVAMHPATQIGMMAAPALMGGGKTASYNALLATLLAPES